MNLNQQVTSLELSKKLKELEVKQESHWYWESYYLPKITTDRHNNIIDSKYIRDIADKRPVMRSGFLTSKLKYYSAYTVAELGEMLPEYLIGDEEMRFELTIWKFAKVWNVSYWWDEDSRRLSGMKIETTKDDTEANARAKMLIYLIENELI